MPQKLVQSCSRCAVVLLSKREYQGVTEQADLCIDGLAKLENGVLPAGPSTSRHPGLQRQNGREQVVRLVLVTCDVSVFMQTKDLRLGHCRKALDGFHIVSHHLQIQTLVGTCSNRHA